MSNEEIIWAWLSERIGNEYGVAGLMGNLQAESGLRPNNLRREHAGDVPGRGRVRDRAVDILEPEAGSV